MSSYDDVIAGLLIFKKYPALDPDEAVYADYSQIVAGPSPEKITDPDDRLTLEAHGWFPSEDDESYTLPG